MRIQSILLYAAGALTIVIAALHIGLPIFTGWYRELKDLTKGSRMTIIDRNTFLILLLLVIALLTFVVNDDLQLSQTGRALMLMLGVYWILRAIWRYLGFPAGAIKTTITIIYLLTGLCFLLALIP